MSRPNIFDAMLSLCPTAKFAVYGDDYDKTVWYSENISKPTKAAVETELQKLQQEYDALDYQRKRQREYPPLSELADALYHQQNGDDAKMTAYLAKCEAVKQKYPKE